MLHRNALVVGLVLFAGCARAPDQRGPHHTSAGHGAGPLLSLASPPPITRTTGTRKFASGRDRGELFVYMDSQRTVAGRGHQDGAYTWHRAELSETHALRAITGRKLHVTSPSGIKLVFDYQRHIEHPSGDWTWIGHLVGGKPSDEAILTFGERAAFGSIAQPMKEPLRLTVRNGVSWLVETDAAMLAKSASGAARPRGPDFLIPPASVRDMAEAAPRTSAADAVPSTPPVGAAVVDLALGFTTGFAASVGGESQAITRLHNLVDITNQAYINSQVNAQVRLVRAVQVAYPDATKNETALEELTGYRSGAGSIPVPDALQPLRSARDQFGADLVSLVRKFNNPENDGCGIAWLLGGGQSGIDSGDAPFAYSIVSDGTDAGDDGNTYFCRDETLAHELGHNMGSQHDRATATVNGVLKHGVFPYSFGYKTGADAGNFFTVMAYGESGQTRYRVFSNPRTTYCGGFACGIDNEADNVRSLNQTIPLVGAFRATVVPVSVTGAKATNDINGDGISDVLWWQPALFAYSLMDGPRFTSSRFFSLSSSYYVAATGDYNGDGKVDVLWTSPANDLYIWQGDGAAFSAPQYVGNYAAGWALVAGPSDVDGDGKSDLLWWRPGQFAYSLMDGARIAASRFFYVSGSYRIAATGDYDGNGKLDLLWTSDANDLYAWMGDGVSFGAPQSLGVYSAGWMIVRGESDVNNDGKSDVLWWRPGQLAYSLLDGARFTTSRFFPLPPGYQVAATGDYDGNDRVDLVFVTPDRQLHAWMGDGSTYAAQYLGTYSSGWQIVY